VVQLLDGMVKVLAFRKFSPSTTVIETRPGGLIGKQGHQGKANSDALSCTGLSEIGVHAVEQQAAETLKSQSAALFTLKPEKGRRRGYT